MRNIKLPLLLAATATLAACSSNETVEVPACTYPAPDNAIPAPDWVCGAPYKDYDLTAVGFSDKSAAGITFMKEQAILAARQELAGVMEAKVEGLVKSYVETTGKGDSETVDAVATSVKKQITSASLVGSRPLMQISTPSGGLAVLVGMDPASVTQVAEDSLKASMNNEKALWQKFQSEKAFDELASDIARLKAER